jgi:hypothetical protein
MSRETRILGRAYLGGSPTPPHCAGLMIYIFFTYVTRDFYKNSEFDMKFVRENPQYLII